MARQLPSPLSPPRSAGHQRLPGARRRAWSAPGAQRIPENELARDLPVPGHHPSEALHQEIFLKIYKQAICQLLSQRTSGLLLSPVTDELLQALAQLLQPHQLLLSGNDIGQALRKATSFSFQ